MPVGETVASTAVQIAVAERKGIAEIWRKIRRSCSKRPQRILIIGAAGTGKTTLGTLLGLPLSERDEPATERYIVSVGTEMTKIRGLSFSKVAVLPGQQHYRVTGAWKAELEKLSRGYYNGIISVVSGGYHALPGDGPYSALYDVHLPGGIPTFLAYHRRVSYEHECEAIRYILPSIKGHIKSLWLLTLVTKEDLWRRRMPMVMEMYSSGPYGATTSEIASALGDRFRHQVRGVSLGLVNLLDGTGREMCLVERGFDQVKRLRSVRQFLETFDQLVGLRNRADNK